MDRRPPIDEHRVAHVEIFTNVAEIGDGGPDALDVSWIDVGELQVAFPFGGPMTLTTRLTGVTPSGVDPSGSRTWYRTPASGLPRRP